MSFFAKKINRAYHSKVNNEENVSTTCTSYDNSATVHKSNNSTDLQNVVDNNVQKNIFFDALYNGNFINK
jgi:hypothetical protein